MKITKKIIESKLPDLRKLKTYEKKFAFTEKEISDKDLVDGFYILLNSKGITNDLHEVEVDDYKIHDSDVTEVTKKSITAKAVQHFKNYKFDLAAINKEVTEYASKFTNVSKDVHDLVIIWSYHSNDDLSNIFGIDMRGCYDNYSLRNAIISSVVEDVLKHRNLPNVKYAAGFSKEDLKGKWTVTENNVLSGFMKNTMTLKFVGYLPGQIKEVRYGERHGLDNFWDDRVSSREFVVLDIINSTGAKEIEKWKKKQYAIDITPTLQVFNTKEEALAVANQLNEFCKESLTLDY